MSMRLIRLFLISMFIACSMYAKDGRSLVVVSSEVNSTELFDGLVNDIEFYYEAKKRQDLMKMYLSEAPHFRYLNNFKDYEAFQNAFKVKYSKVIIDKYTPLATNLSLVSIKLVDHDGIKMYNEKWIKVGDRNYHLLDDLIFFKK